MLATAHAYLAVLRELLAVPSRQWSPAITRRLQDGGRQWWVVPPGGEQGWPLEEGGTALCAVGPAAAGLRAVLRRVLQACLHICS